MSCSIPQLHQLQLLMRMIWKKAQTNKQTITNCSAIIQVSPIMHKTTNFGEVIQQVILTIWISHRNELISQR